MCFESETFYGISASANASKYLLLFYEFQNCITSLLWDTNSNKLTDVFITLVCFPFLI